VSGRSGVELHTSRGPTRLREIEPEWWRLLSCCAQNEPTLTPDWVLAWWDVWGGGDGGRELQVAELRDGGRLVGLAPLVSRRGRRRWLLPLRRIELVCSGEPEADETLSEYLGVLAERGREPEVARTLVSAIAAGRLGEVHELGIPRMSSEDPMAAALAAALRDAGWRTSLVPCMEAPYAELPASWEEYLASLPSRHRYTVRRSERELAAWAGGPPLLQVARDARGLDQGRRVLEALHAERWRAARKRGAFTSTAFRAFHARVMPALLERGALELLWLEVRGEPLAALYNLVWNGKVYNYQSGRRMDLPESVRPGLAAHALAIRRAIELGRREYDFLGSAHRYKRAFSTRVRQLVSLEAARPGPWDAAWRLVGRLFGASADGAQPRAVGSGVAENQRSSS